MSSQSWTVAEAKAKFSEIIQRAMSDGPQTITRNGHTAAVVVGAEEWQRLGLRPTVQFRWRHVLVLPSHAGEARVPLPFGFHAQYPRSVVRSPIQGPPPGPTHYAIQPSRYSYVCTRSEEHTSE